jgi:hypothetical protein
LGDDAAKKKKMKILGIVADERALGTMSCGVEEAFDEQTIRAFMLFCLHYVPLYTTF